MRDTKYATELVTAMDGDHRIERLLIKEKDEIEIRFSWWVNGQMMMRPLDLSEDDLLPLLRQAIEKGVFSEAFLTALHSMLYDARHGKAPNADRT